MANYRTTVFSPASSEVAYRYLADFASIIDWDPSVVSAERTAGEPGELGSRYRVVVGIPLRKIELEYEIVATQAPSEAGGEARVELRAENADVVSYDVITFVPGADGGTDVTYDAELTGKGIRRLADPFFGIVMQVIGHRARGGLATSLGALPAAQS
jgi:hypothetical protein